MATYADPALSIPYGLDADKPANPTPGTFYIAIDTGIVYACYVAGSWIHITPIPSYTFADGYNSSHLIYTLTRSGYNPYDVSIEFKCLLDMKVGYALGKPYANSAYGLSYIYKNGVLQATSSTTGGYTNGFVTCAKDDIIKIRVYRTENATDGGNATTVNLSVSRFTNVDISNLVVREDTTSSEPPIAEVLEEL